MIKKFNCLFPSDFKRLFVWNLTCKILSFEFYPKAVFFEWKLRISRSAIIQDQDWPIGPQRVASRIRWRQRLTSLKLQRVNAKYHFKKNTEGSMEQEGSVSSKSLRVYSVSAILPAWSTDCKVIFFTFHRICHGSQNHKCLFSGTRGKLSFVHWTETILADISRRNLVLTLSDTRTPRLTQIYFLS